MIFSIIIGMMGGLGLFLLGMGLMTKGLRNAAGNALRNILGKWTKTPLKGLASGFLITALVQSSSAITVAAIGFVNAGLMTMAQSVGVIFGSNIGTTVTSWIVAAVGISVNVKALALPLIGIGALLRLTGANSRRRYIGDALTGFGLFFLGIEILQTTFQDLGTAFDLSTLNIPGVSGLLLFVLIGAFLTILMQSSSAAMALVLTAAMSGLVNIDNAAAAAIGTNIGTTSTALFSVIGATYNARKVAGAHIIFNMVTGIIAIVTLPVLLTVVEWIASIFGKEDLTTTLALFHTTFNILGVALFLPFTHQLVRFLDNHIGAKQSQAGKPKYLDDNIISSPTLAMDALFMELGHLGELTRQQCQNAISSHFKHSNFVQSKAAIEMLISSIRLFCVKVQRLDLPGNIAIQLPAALRVLQYYSRASEIIAEVVQQYSQLDHNLSGLEGKTARDFEREVKDLLNIAHTPCSEEFVDLEQYMHELQDSYHALKDELLRAGAKASIPLEKMVGLLEYYSHMRKMCEQAIKGTTYWSLLRDIDITCARAEESNEYTWKEESASN